ncbi:MAG: hypothetical protein ACRDQ7_20050 [Haloechinothrix sp.]
MRGRRRRLALLARPVVVALGVGIALLGSAMPANAHPVLLFTTPT